MVWLSSQSVVWGKYIFPLSIYNSSVQKTMTVLSWKSGLHSYRFERKISVQHDLEFGVEMLEMAGLPLLQGFSDLIPRSLCQRQLSYHWRPWTFVGGGGSMYVLKQASFSRGWQLAFSFEGKVSSLIGKPEESILFLFRRSLLFRVYQIVQWVQYLCGIQVIIKRWRARPKVLWMTLERWMWATALCHHWVRAAPVPHCVHRAHDGWLSCSH